MKNTHKLKKKVEKPNPAPDIECGYCGYKWVSRVQNPKSCPRCKHRFD